MSPFASSSSLEINFSLLYLEHKIFGDGRIRVKQRFDQFRNQGHLDKMQSEIRNLEYELSRHLDSDESIIWKGTPKQGIVLKSADIFMIPFSLMWGGFAISWEISALSIKGPANFMVLFGIPFVVIGLYMIFGRFFYDSARRKNTIYALTNNRIIIKSGVFKKEIKSLNLRTLSDVTLNEKPDGSGTIVLGSDVPFTGIFRGAGWPGVGTNMASAFEMIPDVRKVYREITDLQKDK